MKLETIDFYPDKAQYRPKDSGRLVLEMTASEAAVLKIKVEIKHLEKPVKTIEFDADVPALQFKKINIPIDAPNCEWLCFGADVSIYHGRDCIAELSTAYDVADHWRRAPRYGFLSDFKKEELGDLRDVESLNKFHLNIIQFYDWMYRHDDLVPKTDIFTDPMGRELSYRVVEEKRQEVQKKGMAAIAYGAVYAALKDFQETHPELGLYKSNGEPFELIDIFYIMDISPDSVWTEKIISEFEKVIAAGFDGIHMDQYGFPKKAVRKVGGQEEVVDMANCYGPLIDRTKAAVKKVNPDAGLIFNNVSNYPVHATATADQEAVYIEVWPPEIHFHELKALIDRGRELSGKPVILSAYLPPFKDKTPEGAKAAENGALLTMATIFSSGGYHLLLGENYNVLTEAYYPSYRPMRPEFIDEVRCYYDFIVRYGHFLYSDDLFDVSKTYTGGVNTEVQFPGHQQIVPNGDRDTVWSIVKNSGRYMVLNLINLMGLEDDHWEKGKADRPEVQAEIKCHVLMEKPVKRVFLATPDSRTTVSQSLDYEIVDHDQGRAIAFTLPELKIWDMVVIEWE